MAVVSRPIIEIDDDKCDGCGDCVPVCAEGAIRIVDGKARLVADNLCDGIGNCLGTCPQGAITVRERPAEEYDEAAVAAHLASSPRLEVTKSPRIQLETAPVPHAGSGCPGSQLRTLAPAAARRSVPNAAATERPSMLGQWPVQLHLLPAEAPLWQGVDVLIAADCVPFAMPDFHERLLAEKRLAIACPKLDDVEPYVDKLTTIFGCNDIQSVTVAIMEVPCCGGLAQVVLAALEQAGKQIPVEVVVIGVRGTVDRRQKVEPRVAASR
jgi:Fe-S-cluster-containing hydrogenase component 2